MTSRLETNIDVRRQALHWVVRLAEENAVAGDHPELQQWLTQDPVHQAAFDRAVSVYDVVGDMQHLAELEPLNDSFLWREKVVALLSGVRSFWKENTSQWLKAPVAALALAVVAAVVIYPGMFGGSPDGVDRLHQTYTTRVAEVRDEQLPDGSLVTLGAKSTLKLDFDNGQRRVVLSSGEAFFAVEPDPSRPFIVDAAGATVRVIGTRFEVHRGVERVRIAVVDGAIQVSGAGQEQEKATRQLTAGQQISASYQGELGPMQTVDNTHLAAWRSGFLLYEDASLREVVADANRYFPEKIMLWSEKLGDLQVTASFQTDKIDSLVKSLDIALPLDVIRSEEGHIVLLPERSSGKERE